jgi:gluconolactonase
MPCGLYVFAADARCLVVILMPEMLANFTWGDPDLRRLFLTATTSLYRVKSNTPGTPIFSCGRRNASAPWEPKAVLIACQRYQPGEV